MGNDQWSKGTEDEKPYSKLLPGRSPNRRDGLKGGRPHHKRLDEQTITRHSVKIKEIVRLPREVKIMFPSQ